MDVYRLLRPDEEAEDGIKAKSPGSQTTVFRHVLHGSGNTKSKYISTCGSLSALQTFAYKSIAPGKIVKISLEDLPYIDLRDWMTREKYVDPGSSPEDVQRFHNFANKFEEVLIEHYIPPKNISYI